MPMLFEDFRELLMEKLLILGNGQRYNQVVILAGGAGSGKGWVIRNVIGGDWKVHDPDALKQSLIDISKTIMNAPADMKGKFSRTTNVAKEITGLNLRNPADTAKLHFMVKDLGLDDKQLFLQLAANKGSGNKPNIILDSTLKKPRRAVEAVNMLMDAGYKKEDIHVVWVLTDWRVAVHQNYHRDRRVFNDILIQTHTGAKETMTGLIVKDYPNLKINGDVAVVFGGRAEMVDASGKKAEKGGVLRMKDGLGPLYVRIKRAGKPEFDERSVLAALEAADKLAPQSEVIPSDIAHKYPETHPKTPTRSS
jgi:hypothetical protein